MKDFLFLAKETNLAEMTIRVAHEEPLRMLYNVSNLHYRSLPEVNVKQVQGSRG